MAETKYNPSSSGYTSDKWFIDMFDAYYEYQGKNGWNTASSTIIQGSVLPAYPDQDFKNCNYYGILYFDFAAFRAKYVTHYPARIRLRLKSHVGSSRMLYIRMGKGIAKDSYVSGTRPVNADNGEGGTLTYKNVTCAANAWCELSTTDADWLKALVDPDTTCFYINRNPSGTSPAGDGGYYWEGDGALTSNKPELYIDWIPREPAPTPPPSVTTPGTIKTASNLFDWGNASDTIFPANQLYYEMQVSYNGGTSYTTYTSAQGNSQYTLDIKTALELADKQYYYNTNCKFRVRTKTPLYNGQHYYSSWVSSATFKIDYRIAPSAPSLSVTKAEPYEGEQVTFTVTKPTTHNTLYSDGDAMGVRYYIMHRYGATLTTKDTTFAVDPVSVAYTVPNLTDGDDLTGYYAYVYAVDEGGQKSPNSEPPYPVFNIKRFRVPAVTAIIGERQEEQCTVAVTVMDTGYGGVQSGSQINKVEYRLDDGAWTQATLLGWSGLHNTFNITGLDENTQYDLSVRAVNNAPDGTALSSKTSPTYSLKILEYTPATHTWHDSAATGTQADQGFSAKSLIVGADFNLPVDKGEARIRAIEDGWVKAHETWAYASATTITVPSGAASRYQKGDKLRLKQGGDYKYFYIVGIADTTLTITGGSDYTLTSATITDNYYSKAENPQWFPDWFNWTPTLAGAGSMTFTDVTVDWAVFKISGRKCTCSLRAYGTLGGTPSIQVTATLPITPAETNWPGTGWVFDGSSMQGFVFTASAGRVAINKYDGSNYGLGASKYVNAYIEYRY